MLRNLFKTYTRKCPDKTKHTLYRNINDALPLFITDWDGKLKASTNVVEQVNAEVDARFQSKISGLLYDLDSSNRNIMISFRGVYLVYKSEPCSSFELFKTQMKQIIEDHNRLKILETKIQGLIELGKSNTITEEGFLQAYLEIINDFSKYLPKESTKAKISESRQYSLDWQSAQDGGNSDD